MPFTLEMGRIALAKMDQAVESHREYLTELDSAIGDADHGINMSRGFRKTMEKIQGAEHPDLGALFRDVAMVMMGSVGGASGPLYGTFFMKVSQKLAGKDQVELPQLAEALQEGLNGIVALGKAQVGDKTMVDTLVPALSTLAAEAEGDERSAWAKTVAAAEQGMTSTIPLGARKGRASYLGERSAGHQDPGATSTYLLLNCLRAAALGES